MGQYRYQIFDTVDTKVWKKSINTVKKYWLKEVSEGNESFAILISLIKYL
jgi:hypothetical protein